MKRILALLVAGLVVAVSVPARAADYDRYERGYRYREPGEYPPPPPRRGAEVPPPRHARYGQTYVFGHVGLFEPNSDTDGLDGYDTGGHFDVGFGSRVSPFLAIEGAVGAYDAKRGPDEATVVPLTIGVRLIAPNPIIEPYLGGGLGLYFSRLKEEAFTGFSGIDDTSSDFGGYLSAGADLWLNPRMALNFEGKYHIVNPSFQSNAGNSFDVNMGGWTANLGLRLSF